MRLVAGLFGEWHRRAVMQEHRRPLVMVGRLADRKEYFETTWPEPLSAKRIVACVDDTSAAKEAVTAAADWASALGMSLTILTVAEPAVTLSGKEGSDKLESFLHRLRDLVTDQSVDVSTHLQFDPLGPASGVARTSTQTLQVCLSCRRMPGPE